MMNMYRFPTQMLMFFLLQKVGYVTMTVITGTTTPAPYQLMKSLQLIWRSGAHRFDFQINCHFLQRREGTLIIVPAMGTKWHPRSFSKFKYDVVFRAILTSDIQTRKATSVVKLKLFLSPKQLPFICAKAITSLPYLLWEITTPYWCTNDIISGISVGDGAQGEGRFNTMRVKYHRYHWFRQWFVTCTETDHCLNQWCLIINETVKNKRE